MKNQLFTASMLILILWCGLLSCATSKDQSQYPEWAPSEKQLVDAKDASSLGTPNAEQPEGTYKSTQRTSAGIITKTCIGSNDLHAPNELRGKCFTKTCTPDGTKCEKSGPSEVETYSRQDQSNFESKKEARLSEFETQCRQGQGPSCISWIQQHPSGDSRRSIAVREVCKMKRFQCKKKISDFPNRHRMYEECWLRSIGDHRYECDYKNADGKLETLTLEAVE